MSITGSMLVNFINRTELTHFDYEELCKIPHISYEVI